MNSKKMQDIRLIYRNSPFLYYMLIINYEKEKQKMTIIYNCIKRIKCLRINLLRRIKHIFWKNYKTLMKEIGDDTNIWKDIVCVYIYIWTGRSNIVKISILPKGVWRHNTMPIKISITFFYRRKRINNPKFVWNHKCPQIDKSILIEKKHSWKYYAG